MQVFHWYFIPFLFFFSDCCFASIVTSWQAFYIYFFFSRVEEQDESEWLFGDCKMASKNWAKKNAVKEEKVTILFF